MANNHHMHYNNNCYPPSPHQPNVPTNKAVTNVTQYFPEPRTSSSNKRKQAVAAPSPVAVTEKPRKKTKTSRTSSSSNKDYPMKNIAVPGDHDVVCGRGGMSIHHEGNIRFRKLVRAHQKQYIEYGTNRHLKTLKTYELVNIWRRQQPPGRFLKQDKNTGLWEDVGISDSRRKTAQLLREGAGKVREALACDEDSQNTSTTSTVSSMKPTKRSNDSKKDEKVESSTLMKFAATKGMTLDSTKENCQNPTNKDNVEHSSRATAPRPCISASTNNAPSSSSSGSSLLVDLKTIVRSGPPTFSYGEKKTSLELLQAVFEDTGILDDTTVAAAYQSMDSLPPFDDTPLNIEEV